MYAAVPTFCRFAFKSLSWVCLLGCEGQILNEFKDCKGLIHRFALVPNPDLIQNSNTLNQNTKPTNLLSLQLYNAWIALEKNWETIAEKLMSSDSIVDGTASNNTCSAAVTILSQRQYTCQQSTIYYANMRFRMYLLILYSKLLLCWFVTYFYHSNQRKPHSKIISIWIYLVIVSSNLNDLHFQGWSTLMTFKNTSCTFRRTASGIRGL